MAEKGGFQFVHIASPGDAAAWKRQVRAHAARNPRSRKQRVSRHQSMAGASLKSSLAGPVADKAAFDTTTWAYERLPRGMSAASVDPFDTFARIPTRVEWSLLHHFQKVVLAQGYGCLPFPSAREASAFMPVIGMFWTQMAAVDGGMLAAILGITCRSLARIRQDGRRFEELSYLYNYHCLHSINQDIQAAERIKPATVTKTLILALDCFSVGDWSSGWKHVSGLERMMEMRGEKNADMGHAQPALISWLINTPAETEKGFDIVSRLSLSCRQSTSKEMCEGTKTCSA